MLGREMRAHLSMWCV